MNGFVALLAWLATLLVGSFLANTDILDSELFAARAPHPVPSATFNGSPFFFLHVSDIHINHKPQDKSIENLRLFLDRVVQPLAPPVVLVTGDLTNAKTGGASRQDEQEWITYKSVIQDAPSLNRTKWLDLRGNHDSFGVAHWDSPINFYKTYGFSSQAYSAEVRVRIDHIGEYCFIGFDAATIPGAHRPANFFGLITPPLYKELQRALADHAIPKKTVLYNHFPASTLEFQTSSSLQGLVNEVQVKEKRQDLVAAHLSGHLHSLLEHFPRGIRAARRNSFLELEGPDLWTSNAFRVCAFDGNNFAYSDFRLQKDTSEQLWILATNPPDLDTSRPEQGQLAKESSELRFLVFSSLNPFTHDPVTVILDDEYLGVSSTEDGRLHTLAWQPAKYDDGVHRLTFKRQDEVIGLSRFSFRGESMSTVGLKRVIQRILENAFSLTRFPEMGNTIVMLSLISYLILFGLAPKVDWMGSTSGSRTNGPENSNCLEALLFKLSSSTGARYPWMGLLVLGIYAFVGPTTLSAALTDTSRPGMTSPWGVVFFRSGTLPLQYIRRRGDQALVLVFVIFKCLFPLTAAMLLFVAYQPVPARWTTRVRVSGTQLFLLWLAFSQAKESGLTALQAHGLVGFVFSVGGLPSSLVFLLVFQKIVPSLVKTTKLSTKST